MKQRRNTGWCSHGTILTTITAGMAREVCESCGQVSLRYVEEAVQSYPKLSRMRPPSDDELREIDLEEQVSQAVSPRKCTFCRQLALFMIPDGLVCDEHAWQAAARLDWETSDPWVPIRIDKSNA